MQSIFLERADLERLAEDFEAILREMPEERRKMYERAGAEILNAVRWRIGGRGKVQSWQDSFVGSGGGYAAVRAVANLSENGYAVGYITNAIENQHRQQKGRYVPGLGKRLVRDTVPGKHMYMDTVPEAERIAYDAAGQFISALKLRMEG